MNEKANVQTVRKSRKEQHNSNSLEKKESQAVKRKAAPKLLLLS